MVLLPVGWEKWVKDYQVIIKAIDMPFNRISLKELYHLIII